MVAGEIIAGKWVKKACQRHLDDLESGHERGLKWDKEAGQHAVDFFGYLRHSKGKEWGGKRFDLSPWQVFIVASVFGWKRSDGRRRFRTIYVEIPRKNGKSTLAAGIALYLLVGDGEPGAEVYAVATKKDQARIVFHESKRMVKASKHLARRLEVFKDSISWHRANAKYEPLGSEEDSLDGLNPSGLIADEVHAWKNRGLFDVLDTALGARSEPVFLLITTAGSDRESVCYEQRRFGEQVLDGLIADESGDAFFAYIACPDDGVEWDSPEAIAQANPNLGVSVQLEYLVRKFAEAKHKGPAAVNAAKRLYLDIWTRTVAGWVSIDVWDRGAVPEFTVDDLAGLPCYAGLDVANSLDVAACVLCFPWEQGFRLLPFFWLPEECYAEREERLKQIFLPWAELGFVKLTPGNTIDTDVIEDDLIELATKYDLRELAYDPHNADTLAQHLAKAGLTPIKFLQNIQSYNEPVKEAERLMRSGHLWHAGNPILRWMMGNVAMKVDGRGYKMPARKASTEKIDGVVAMLMSLARAMRCEGGSIYDAGHGFTVLGGDDEDEGEAKEGGSIPELFADDDTDD